MLIFEINKPKENDIVYKINGTQKINNKEYKTQFIVYAKNEESAKEKLNDYKMTHYVKYTLSTFGIKKM